MKTLQLRWLDENVWKDIKQFPDYCSNDDILAWARAEHAQEKQRYSKVQDAEFRVR